MNLEYVCKYCNFVQDGTRLDRRLHLQFHIDKMDALEIVERFYKVREKELEK